MRFGIKETKQTLIEDDMIIFIENSKFYKLLNLISRFNMLGLKEQYSRTIDFLCISNRKYIIKKTTFSKL